MLRKFSIQTKHHSEMVDITSLVQDFITEEQVINGSAVVYSPHTTAGITINENADPDVKTDMLRRFDEVFPLGQRTRPTCRGEYSSTYENEHCRYL